MKIIIHRGSQTIGGTCIEVCSHGHRIILDMGMPLMESDGSEINKEKLSGLSIENGILPDVDGLYNDQDPSVDAVIISHAHIDHYGLLNHLHPSIQVYLSQGSHELIKIGRIFYQEQNKIIFDNYKFFKHWSPFEIGPFTITSYLMDHSGYDASAFLIEAEGKKIFYSGDFRGHGRKAKLLDRLVEKPILNVDCLLLEGTTIGGGHSVGFATEADVENGLYQILASQEDLSLIMASGSNIDRMVSIYKAAVRSNKILVLDLYTFYVLNRLKKLTPSLPPNTYMDNIRIYYLKFHADCISKNLDKKLLYAYKKRKIETDEIINHRNQMVLKLPVTAMRHITEELNKERSIDKAKFIFSVWPGYLEKNKGFYDFCNKYHIELLQIHTSGHAYLDDLKRLATALKPRILIPVHTLHGDEFTKHFNNVTRLNDGVSFDL